MDSFLCGMAPITNYSCQKERVSFLHFSFTSFFLLNAYAFTALRAIFSGILTAEIKFFLKKSKFPIEK